MAIDWAAFDSAVLAWLGASTGWKSSHVIFAYQAGPRPGLPYAEANTRFSIKDQGMRDEVGADALIPGQLDYIARRDVTVSVRTLGPGALAAADAANTYLQT